MPRRKLKRQTLLWCEPIDGSEPQAPSVGPQSVSKYNLAFQEYMALVASMPQKTKVILCFGWDNKTDERQAKVERAECPFITNATRPLPALLSPP